MAKGTSRMAWFQTPKWYEDKKDEVTKSDAGIPTCYCIGIGIAVTAHGRDQPSEVKHYTRKDGREDYLVKTTIVHSYGIYDVLISYGDNKVSRALAKIDKGEVVLVLGKKMWKTYKNRKGEIKEFTEIEVGFAMTTSHVQAIEDMYLNPSIQTVMNGGLPEMPAPSAETPSDSGQTEEYAPPDEMSLYDNSEYENESDYEFDEDAIESAAQGLPFR